jgi:membrane protease YdiL (CAAX protease family)
MNVLNGGSVRLRAYLRPIVAGLLIAAAGLIPWAVIAPINKSHRPDIPWAALATAAFTALLIAWLHGFGPPVSTSLVRRQSLRLWPPSPAPDATGGSLPVAALVLLLAAIYVVWIVVGRLSPVPDLSGYPTTAYRFSMFFMGGILAGVVEEAGFRGYMQTGLERLNPGNAVLITSMVFTGAHITQGPKALLLLGPGLFAASMLYGTLARRTGTILPGMLIHVAGDLAYTWFGVLRGDASLLFVTR